MCNKNFFTIDFSENNVGKKLVADILKQNDLSPFEKFNAIQKDIIGDNHIITDDCTLMLLDFK